MSDVPAPGQGSIAKGLGLLLLLHAAAAVVCGSLAWIADGDPLGGLSILLGIGFVQILYVAPAAIVLSSKRRPRTLKGLLIGAGITLLVNAACAGIVLSSIGH